MILRWMAKKRCAAATSAVMRPNERRKGQQSAAAEARKPIDFEEWEGHRWREYYRKDESLF